ncbi:hypothetical protein [Melittangium boletus]|nr:hypothetical protein [Melittangium boletus]
MQLRMAAAALSLGLLGSGCASISQVQTADTLGAGKFQFALEPGLAHLAVAESETGTEASANLPQFDIALRYGVTDRLDLGARLGTSLVELQGKYLFTNPENPTLAVSLAPSLSGFVGGAGPVDVGYVRLALPLLVGFKTSGGSEFVLGPRLEGTRFLAGADGSSASLNYLSGGASVGYALRVSEGFRLMPEVAYSRPFAGAVTAGDQAAGGTVNAGGTWQFKLGFLFGQGRPTLSARSSGETYE